jgi:hypothetical protein
MPWDELPRGEEQDFWDKQFLGKHPDDHVVPGAIAMLPKWFCQKSIYYIDPKIEKGAYGRPVILVRSIGDGFWNVVLVS